MRNPDAPTVRMPWISRQGDLAQLADIAELLSNGSCLEEREALRAGCANSFASVGHRSPHRMAKCSLCA